MMVSDKAVSYKEKAYWEKQTRKVKSFSNIF